MLQATARVWVFSILVFALLANVAVATFVIHERTVYFWDFRSYWHRVQLTTRAAEKLLRIHRSDLAGASVSHDRQPDQRTRVQGDRGAKGPSLAHSLAMLLEFDLV